MWADLAVSLGLVMGVWADEPCYPKLQKFAVAIMEEVVHKVRRTRENDCEASVDGLGVDVRSTVYYSR